MYLIGITGSIGSGKTTLAEIFKNLGYEVYDVDGWVRDIYKDNSFLANLKKIFPESFKNGVVDKRYLRGIVFSDKNKLKDLEDIVYPLLNKKIENLIDEKSNNKEICFLDIALLFEKGWNKYCDFIILADADYELRKKRVMQRDNVSSDDFEKINSVQISNELKKKNVDVVIDTNKNIDVLKKEMIDLMKTIDGEKI